MRITLHLLRDGVDIGQIILNKAKRYSSATLRERPEDAGFHAVKDADIEPDFGLRVVANSVDPAKLTRAEARGLEKGTNNSVPVPNAVFALDLSTSEEWIRRFGDQMEDRTFAASASGADSLQLTRHEFNIADLPDGREVFIGGRRRSTEESSRRRLVVTVRVACQVRAGGCRFLPLIRIDPR